MIAETQPAALGPGIQRTSRAASLIPLAAGVFVGVLVFDALPMAFGAVGGWALLWAALGLTLMLVSSRWGRDKASGWAAGAASFGVWLHAILEGVAAGAGIRVGAGGAALLLMGLIVHLVPESIALYAVLTRNGLPARRAAARCAATWGLVVAGFAGAQLSLLDAGASAKPLGMAMGVAVGSFAFMAWVLWKQRSRSGGSAWAAALMGFAWVALIHL